MEPLLLCIVVPSEEISEDILGDDFAFFEIVGATPVGLTTRGETLSEFCAVRRFIGAATWSEALGDVLRTALRQIREFRDETPDIFVLEGERSAAALLRLAGICLASQFKSCSERAELLSRELDKLRVDYETIKENFATTASYVARAGFEPISCVFASDPDESHALSVEPDPSTEIGIAQILPVSVANFYGFEIHIPNSVSGDGASVDLRLSDRGSGKIFALWRAVGTQLRPGWNRFGLDAPLASAHAELELQISSLALPDLSLSRPIDVSAYQLIERDSGEPITDRMLAIRLYSALPGMTPEFHDAARPLDLSRGGNAI